MKSGIKLIAALQIIAGMVFLGVACGDYKGQGSNDPKIGALVKVSEIIPQDRGEDTHDIDMWLSVCDNTTVPPEMEDPLTEATMIIKVFNDDETSACASQGCPDVYILSYKVEFESDDPNAVPLSSIQRDIYLFIEAGEELTADGLVLMPWSTKQQFFNKYKAWLSITPYTAKLTFKGEDEFGQEFEFKTQTYLACGDWWVCN
jgi:hypothetical protein